VPAVGGDAAIQASTFRPECQLYHAHYHTTGVPYAGPRSQTIPWHGLPLGSAKGCVRHVTSEGWQIIPLGGTSRHAAIAQWEELVL